MPLSTSDQSGDRTRGGYLLLELLLGLAVLTIVVTLVFRIIQTSTRIVAGVQFSQEQQERVDGIEQLLRSNFLSLPATVQFQTKRRGDVLELIFRRAAFHFGWASPGAKFGTIALAARPRPDGLMVLSALEEPEDATSSAIDQGTEEHSIWTSIAGDLTRFNWRFYDLNTGEWKTEWADQGSKPGLIEAQFQLAGQSRVERTVFRWPIAQSTR